MRVYLRRCFEIDELILDGHYRLQDREKLANEANNLGLIETYAMRCKASHGDKALQIKEFCFDNDCFYYYDEITELVLYIESVKNEYEFEKLVESRKK